MDIMELGAIGELVGGVAVIATLVYLSLQVRHSVRVARAASFRDAKANFNTLNSSIARDANLADLFVRGTQDFDALGPAEQLRFGQMLLCYFNLFETLFQESRDGYAQSQWPVEERSMLAVFGMGPGVRSWWRGNPLSFSDDFRGHVDGLLAARVQGA